MAPFCNQQRPVTALDVWATPDSTHTGWGEPRYIYNYIFVLGDQWRRRDEGAAMGTIYFICRLLMFGESPSHIKH